MKEFKLISISTCASELPQIYVHFKDWMIFNEKEEKENDLEDDQTSS